MDETTTNQNNAPGNGLSGFIAAAGVILAVSYPVLAIATGFRAVYQIIEGDPTNSPYLSLIASLLYATATVGFVVRRRWAWQLSFGALLIEAGFTLVIGVLSFAGPELIGRNVWQYFGRDYGYFPLVQPLLGLLWLIHPQTRAAYGIGDRSAVG
ncbi:MAG: hypothetical protein M9928_08510 [Anaerolineae bacterium]|nr:hypothetical protein [Anaerolineae bacterium]